MDRHALERAAARFGIELEYTDTWGGVHSASDDALRAILVARGVPCSSDGELDAALERQTLAAWSVPFPPAIVIREGQDSIAVRIPEEYGGASVKLEFQWESGEIEHHWYWLPELRELEREQVAGRTFLAKRVPLPANLPLGYHRLLLYRMREPELETIGQARFIVCPEQAFAPERRMAGVAMSLYGLRSARNWGCGDFTDLAAAVDTFAPAGAQFIALNPLHAIPNRMPYNTSPYLPECSLYRSFLYLDVEKVPGYAGDPADAAEIAALRETEFVEYERVASLKLKALERAFRRFGTSPEFEAFAAREGALLEDFARYRALYRELHARYPDVWLWTDWPGEYRDPRSPAVAEWAGGHRREIDFYKFLQWQVDAQLAQAQSRAVAAGMAVGLYHDLALATDRFGADLWANRAFYVTGARVGAPPDELAPGGQDWGFPPPDRDAHRANGYELFAQGIRRNARHGGALRIDHVMRFFRLFWIPDELTAKDGVYVRDYVDDVLGILALESVRNRFIVIGEDLGTVPPGVRETLGPMNVLGYRLLWFERDGDGRFRLPHEYAEHSAVSSSTHDLPTLAGFRLGRDIEARKAAGLVDDAAYAEQWSARHREIQRLDEALQQAGFAGDPLGFLLSTPCVVAIVNQEDLTGETEQQNLPASTWQYPNWRRKMRVLVEDFQPLADDLRTHIERARR